MASDDLCKESSTTQQLTWEPPVFHSSLYPALEPTHDNIGFRPTSWSDQAVPFHWMGHPDVITPTMLSASTQGTYGLNPSNSIDPNSHYPPLQMADTTTPFYSYSEPTPSHPSSHVTPQEVSPARSLMSYPYGSITGPPRIQEVNLQPSAQSLNTSNTLPSLREPGHDASSNLQSMYLPEHGFLPLLGDIGPGLWAGPQACDQEFHQELTATRNSVPVAPSPSTPIPITALSNTGAMEPYCLRPPVEEFRINSGEIYTHNQVVDKHPSPTSSAAGRKRKRAPNPSNMADRPPKRRNRARDRPTLDVQNEALMNNVTSADGSLPCQSRSSHVITPPTTAEVQRLEQIEYIHYTQQTNGGELFRNASNFTIKDSKMTTVGVQHVYMQGGHSMDPALQWLREYAMKGAEHDSAARDPPPRCHPGTRTTIIKNVQDWLGSSEQEKNLLWLRGAADTGRLGASLFFSRLNGRSNPRQILPTLAYQFAIQDPSYREYINQFVLTNPESLDKAMSEQFRILIIEPFVRKGIRSGKVAWVVTLDGLDECGEDPNGRRHSNDAQREVVYLISGFVRQYPTAPLTWIIASRPETHLKAAFSKPDVVSTCWEEEVPVDSDEACEDVEKFLYKKFTEIGENYPEYIHDSPWPTHKQFLKIAHAALGLFIFAEVVVRFIGDPEVGNPIAQLECVLVAISKMRSKNRQNPLANLDVVYLAILSKIPPSTLQITKHLLGFFILLNKRAFKVSDCNFGGMCKVLNISEDIGVTALRHLHSVLYFPKAKDLGTTRPRFYHASFRDFLEDESRSHEYFIDKRTFTLDQLIPNLLRVAQAQFSFDPDSPLSYSPDEDGSLITVFVWVVFSGHFSSDGVRFKKFRWITNFLPDAQLQPLLESLNIIKLLGSSVFALDPVFWNFREQDECELTRRGFLSCTTFRSLGINWDTVCVSISKLCGFQHVQVGTTSGIQTELHGDQSEVQEFLRRSKTAVPDQKVWVWGHRNSGCRVAVISLSIEGVYKHYAITGIPSVTT